MKTEKQPAIENFLQGNWQWLTVLMAIVGVGIATIVTVQQTERPVREKIPELVLRDFNNEDVVIYTDFLEGHPAVINFWAAWCIFCKEEMPLLERLYQEYVDEGLIVIGVHRSDTESKERAKEFLAEEVSITYPLFADPGSHVYQHFAGGSLMVPLTVIVDSEGFVVEQIFGPRPEARFRELVERALEPE